MATSSKSERRVRIAVDIGGTFTDLAAFDEDGERLSFGKALSTHDALVRGIAQTIASAGVRLDEAELFLHGSTIAINTLLERTGARTALVTTRGFRDVYEIGRINRPDAYNLFFDKHRPLVDRSWRFEVDERLLADGSEHRPLDEGQVRAIARELQQRGVEAVAVLLLHSYRNSAHEKKVSEILGEGLPCAFITASHELTQEYREFERTSTVAANAYVGPRIAQYLGEIEAYLDDNEFGGDFYAVQSTGGLFSVAQARRECVRMLESGPAAGVIGAQAVCQLAGLSNAVAFDMGGTTAKAGVISDLVPLTSSRALIGAYERALPIQVPMIEIFEVGTGGGSIARLVEGDALRVGPTSAGSMPGPACYGRGGREPTITDANLVLGRLNPDQFLGGEMPLDRGAAEAAIRDRIATPLGLDLFEAAEGILRIGVTAMSHAVKAVTTERGLDIGSFAMITYGGAGPLHASAIAREIGIRRVLIPPSPGHFSAFGMLYGDLRYDYVRSCFERLNEAVFDDLELLFVGMEDQGRALIEASAANPKDICITRYADMRYVGQEHSVTVELDRAFFSTQDRVAIKAAFDADHLQRYGTSAPDERAEIVSVRATIAGIMPKPPRHPLPAGQGVPAAAARLRTAKVCFRARDGFVGTAVYARDALSAGDRIDGPALIEEHASTTVLSPGDRMLVDPFGILDIAVGAAA